MKRRELIGYAGSGLVVTLGLGLWQSRQPALAQSDRLTIKGLGHSCFLFTGGGVRILVNPFRRIGCTAGYRPPLAEADLVLISSRLFDEGYLQDLVDAGYLENEQDSRVLSEAKDYSYDSVTITSTAVPHDREGGRRFGENVIWRWSQAGINIVHMGGAAAPLGPAEQTLFNRPDLLFVPVGGGPKAYNAEEAVQAIQVLKPKVVVPTQYLTQAADPESCDLSGVDAFLALMQGVPVTRATNGSLSVRPSDLPQEGMRIQIYEYNFG